MIRFGVSYVQQHGPVFDTPDFQNYLFIGLLLIAIVVIIFLLYRYVLPKHVEGKFAETQEPLIAQKSADQDRTDDKSEIKQENASEQHESRIEVALRLLAADERKVVQAIIDAQGTMLQKDISWNTGLSRVKTHRILEKLIQRGIVTSEKYYNTKKVTLAEWLINAQNPNV
ncbi:MAG: DUF7343 domain-containing protein [Candidatus Hermodarchaeia archaeon]|jgi:uncharacterized membrane protein